VSAFIQSLDDELRERGETRVNALASTVGERAAAVRYGLDRDDRDHCDGWTTEATPGYAPGVPIEVKTVRVEHHDGTGRLGIHPGSHKKLVAAGGDYAVVLYGEVDHEGDRRIVVLATEIVAATDVGRYLRPGASGYQKVRWDLLLDVKVDRSRW